MQSIARAAEAPDPRRRIVLALDGLLDVLEGRLATAVCGRMMPGSGEPVFSEMLDTGQLTEPERRLLYGYLASQHAIDPFLAAMGEAWAKDAGRSEIIVHARHELVNDAEWEECEFVKRVRDPIGLGSSLYGCLRLEEPGAWVGIGVHRPRGGRNLGAQDVAVARAFMLGIKPMLMAFDAAPKGVSRLMAELQPRQREVMMALMNGQTAKEIGRQLHVTTASAQTYIKRLYRSLGVSGRGELVALGNRHGLLLGGAGERSRSR